MTSKLLPLNHNLGLGHALDIRLTEKVLCSECFVSEMLRGKPFGCEFVACISLLAPGRDDGGVVYDYFGSEGR